MEEIKAQNIFSPDFAKQIGELLQRGDCAKIYKALNCSPASVSQIFNGKYTDYSSELAKSIIRKGVELVKQHEKKDSKDASAIVKLIQQ